MSLHKSNHIIKSIKLRKCKKLFISVLRLFSWLVGWVRCLGFKREIAIGGYMAESAFFLSTRIQAVNVNPHLEKLM